MWTFDNAVPGLTFTATTRVLSGTPTTAATTALTYTVTDERGSTASDTFDPHRGSRGGPERPGRPDLYDGPPDHWPDPAGWPPAAPAR